MKTVIMAGGRGTRISSIAPNVPKPMIKINHKPVLEHEIDCLRSQGFTDIIITVSHMAQQIMDYFGDGSGTSAASGEPFGVHIDYFVEDEPLGNAGALLKLWQRGAFGKPDAEEDFLLLNADAVFDVDFNRFVAFHQSQGVLASLFTHPNSHPYDSGLITADQDCRVTAWLTKEDPRPEYYKNRVNAGLHVINSAIFHTAGIDPEAVGTAGADGRIIKADLDRQLLKPLAGSGKLAAYDSPEYVKDMGTPQRLHSVLADLASGLVQARNLRNMQRAVFLDRDGTINKYAGFLNSPDQMALEEGAAEAVRRINDSGYLAVIVTNQPVIARGEVTVDGLNRIHDKLETLLGEQGAYVDGIYYCPHHPDKGFEGEVAKLKIDCSCRKPKPGLLEKAAGDFHIDLKSSWMIGDDERDIKAGQAAGCKTVYLDKGRAHEGSKKGGSGAVADYGQDADAKDLLEAVTYILGEL